MREVKRRQKKVLWTFFPLNGRTRFFVRPGGNKG